MVLSALRAVPSRLFALARGRAAALPMRRALCTETLSSPKPQLSLFAHIQQQVASEFAGALKSPVHAFGFFGALCNWFLGISGVYDATTKGPEVISLKMTCVMLCYSTLFGRWAGWAVNPRNFTLCGAHAFNVLAQTNQLRRCLEFKLANEPNAQAEITELATKAAIGGAIVGTCILTSGRLQALVAPYGPAYLSSPGGPFTIHPWPPATKLLISGTSLMELDRPTDKISMSQYSALTVTGAIFSGYGLVVSPINYPLTAVNVLLFASSAYHLGRKVKADYL